MIDWNAIGDEAGQLLSSYLQIKSINPPGDERETADFLSSLLRNRGLEPQIYTTGSTSWLVCQATAARSRFFCITTWMSWRQIQNVGPAIPLAEKPVMDMYGDEALLI